MPIPTITPSYVRATWGEYQPFVFRFLYTVGTTDYYYDCENIPEGWNAQSIKITRNRSNIGLVRTYAEGVTFIGDDATFLLDYFNTYRFNVQMKVEIYKLNTVTIDYDIYYQGFADFTKFSYKDFKFKLDLIDNQVQALIDNNADKEYSLLPSDYSPYLLDFEYSGIRIVEMGKFEGTSPSSPIVTIPSRTSSPAADVYIDVPLGGTVPSNGTYDVDTKLSDFLSQDYEYVEYIGSPASMSSTPFFISGANGVTTIRTNTFFISLSIPFPYTDENNAYIKDVPDHYNLYFYNGGVGTGQSYYSISSGNIYWPQDPSIPTTAKTTLLIENYSCSFSTSTGSEVYLVLVLYRTNFCNTTFPITINSTYCQLDVKFKENEIAREFKVIRYDQLLELSLLKTTNNIGRIVNNSDVDFSKVFMFNGNMIRNLLGYSLNVKLTDLLTFIMRKYGIGYELDGYNMTFYNIGDFFDITQEGYTFDEPANFEIISNTDLVFSTIKAGDKPFDSEYLSGKFSVHEETIFKTPVDAVTNEQDLMCEISTNPFEIEDMVRNALDSNTQTDYSGDYQLVAILGNLKTDDLWQIDRAFVEADSMPADYFYPDTIYNLTYSPIRIIERNLMYAHQTLFNDCDTIKAQKRTKYEDFYCSFLGENVKYEFADFKIYPRCTGSDPNDPHLTNDDYKIEPLTIQFTIPTTQFDLSTLLANAKKKMKVTYNGVEYFGFLDDFGLNILNNEPQTVRLIEAHATI